MINPIALIHLGITFVIITVLFCYAGYCLDLYFNYEAFYILWGALFAFIFILYIVWKVLKANKD